MSQRTRREIIIADNSLDLKQNVNEMTTEPENKNDVLKSVDVPPNKLYGHNLKKIKTFKKLRRGYKLNNQKVIFINDLSQLLQQFPSDNHQYDDELLIEILNIAESFFIYGSKEEREQAKEECIFEIMLPYFKNDKQLLSKTISHIWRYVNKSNMCKRMFSRFKHFFLPTK